MGFSENLKRKREEAGLSQKELADLTGITQPMIAQYEKGIKLPTVITAVDISDVLHVTCHELVKGERSC